MTSTVNLVLSQHPAMWNLEQNTRSISNFLGPPPSLLLSEACTLGKVPLLNWIWFASCTNIDDRIPGWSLTNYLRSDPHYYRWQFTKSLYVAAGRGDVAIVKWLFAHFEKCEAPFEVVEAAARGGHLHVLRLLWQHRSRIVMLKGSTIVPVDEAAQDRDVPLQDEGVCTVQFNESFSAENWGETAITRAVENGQLVECLDNGMRLGCHDRRVAIQHALNIGEYEFARSLLPEGSTDLDFAFTCPQPEVITRIIESGYMQWDEKYAATALTNIAKSESVELMEQLFQLHSPLREDHLIWKDAWRNALKEACSYGHLNVLSWLMEHSFVHELEMKKLIRGYTLQHELFRVAGKRGHVEVMQYLFEHGLTPDLKGWATHDAICEGQLASVKWLADHDLIGDEKMFSLAIDRAARYGRLEILHFFHKLNIPSGYEDAKIKRTRTGKPFTLWGNAVYWAARNGHIHVLDWLSKHYPSKRDIEAMDIAASEGQLETVKWLYAKWRDIPVPVNASSAIFSASGRGHLNVVKWLCDNRPESYQWATQSVVRAVRYGHIRIANWLRVRFPQCMHRADDFYVEPQKKLVGGGWMMSNSFEKLLFLQAVYPAVYTSDWYSLLSILRKDYSNASKTDSHTTEIILGWLNDNYPQKEHQIN